MKSEQMLMGLGASELRRCGNAVVDEFIANRLAESTTGENRLMESICAVDNRRAALKRVVSNNGAPGVDGIKARELPGTLNRCWSAIKASLLDGTYEPMPVRRKAIDKPDGERPVAEYRILNMEPQNNEPSIFEIPCSIFNIPMPVRDARRRRPPNGRDGTYSKEPTMW